MCLLLNSSCSSGVFLISPFWLSRSQLLLDLSVRQRASWLGSLQILLKPISEVINSLLKNESTTFPPWIGNTALFRCSQLKLMGGIGANSLCFLMMEKFLWNQKDFTYFSYQRKPFPRINYEVGIIILFHWFVLEHRRCEAVPEPELGSTAEVPELHPSHPDSLHSYGATKSPCHPEKVPIILLWH